MTSNSKKDIENLAGSVAGHKPGQNTKIDDAFNEEDIRVFFGEDGHAVGVGSVDDTFEIRQAKKPLIKDLDSWDKEVIENAMNSSLIKDWLADLSQRSASFIEWFQTLLVILYRDEKEPELIERPAPSQLYLLKLVTEVISHEDWESLHESCKWDPAAAALGAKTIVDALNDIISDEDLEMLQKIDEAAQNMSGVMEKLAAFMQAVGGNMTTGNMTGTGQASCSGQGSLGPEGTIDPVTGQEVDACGDCGEFHPPMRPKTPSEMGMSAEEAREHIKEMTKQFSELMAEMNQKLEETMEKLAPATEQAVDKATKKAKGRVNHMQSMLKDFGTGQGDYSKVPMQDALELMHRYENDREVKNLLDELGQKMAFARKPLRKMTETVSNMKNKPAILDGNPVTMMPHEMVKARSKKTQRNFKKRLAEKEVECYDTRGQRSVNRGPIVVCKDTSGSMHGPPNTWASGLTLALASLAKKQKRDVVLINFGSRQEIKCYEFSKSSTINEAIDGASFMFGGGTDFETPLRKAADFIKESKYNKADVLFITDGCCSVSDSFMSEFKKLKKKREFKVISVVITVGYSFGRVDVLEKFSDSVTYLSDLQKDEDLLQTAFAF
jgi:uncharacterized protein with von Willebrand factor type A (vWA) domain